MPAVGEEEGFLRRVREGEAAALEEFWQRFGARITAYAATRLAGDEELVEEMMVQTLAAAVRSIASFDARRSSLSAWVYGVARRVIGLELRKQRKRSSVPAAAKVALDETIGQQAEQDLTSRLEAQRQVRALAAALSQAEMEVLTLHFVDEFSVKEIAQIVGRSWRAVDSLLHRAKQKARERLEKDGN